MVYWSNVRDVEVKSLVQWYLMTVLTVSVIPAISILGSSTNVPAVNMVSYYYTMVMCNESDWSKSVGYMPILLIASAWPSA